MQSEEAIIGPRGCGNDARFVYHSCDANSFLELIRIGDHEIVVISTLRKIAKGEEITILYGYNTKDDDVPLVCKCNTAKCT